MRYSTIAVAAAFIALGASGARAQVCTDATHCNTGLTATVPTLVEFTGITGTFDFGTFTTADFNAGHKLGAGPVTLTHHGNVPYTVTFNAGPEAQLRFNASHGDPDPLKPFANVTIQETTVGGPNAHVLTAAGSTLYQRMSKGGDLTTTMTADMALNYANDVPGDYSTTVFFTITAN